MSKPPKRENALRRYAAGGLVGKPEASDWTDNIINKVRPVRPAARDAIDRKPTARDKQMENVFTPDLYQGRDKYPATTGDDKPQGAAKGGKITRVAGKPVGKEDGLIAAQKGEFVIKRASVRKYGDEKMAAVNRGTAKVTAPKRR